MKTEDIKDPFDEAMEAVMGLSEPTAQPEDGADVAVTEDQTETPFVSQFEFGTESSPEVENLEVDESFHAITPEDELFHEPRPEISLYETADDLRELTMRAELFNHSYFSPTDGYSRKTGLASPAAIFGKATTTKDRGWDVVLHLPETVKGKDIDDLRDGYIRVVVLPEHVANKLISDAMDNLIAAIDSVKKQINNE